MWCDSRCLLKCAAKDLEKYAIQKQPEYQKSSMLEVDSISCLYGAAFTISVFIDTFLRNGVPFLELYLIVLSKEAMQATCETTAKES